MARPPRVEIAWREDRFALVSEHQVVWSGTPLTLAGVDAATAGPEAFVLIVDRPGGLRFRELPKLAPSLIWAARLPVCAAESAEV